MYSRAGQAGHAGCGGRGQPASIIICQPPRQALYARAAPPSAFRYTATSYTVYVMWGNKCRPGGRTWKVTTPRGSRRCFSLSPATPSFLRMSPISWEGISGCDALSSANASLQRGRGRSGSPVAGGPGRRLRRGTAERSLLSCHAAPAAACPCSAQLHLQPLSPSTPAASAAGCWCWRHSPAHPLGLDQLGRLRLLGLCRRGQPLPGHPQDVLHVAHVASLPAPERCGRRRRPSSSRCAAGDCREPGAAADGAAISAQTRPEPR